MRHIDRFIGVQGLNLTSSSAKHKILIINFLLSNKELDTSHKLYMRHGTLAGHLILVSIINFGLATFCAKAAL